MSTESNEALLNRALDPTRALAECLIARDELVERAGIASEAAKTFIRNCKEKLDGHLAARLIAEGPAVVGGVEFYGEGSRVRRRLVMTAKGGHAG